VVTPVPDRDGMRRIAKQLEAENPGWIVLYGGSSREFVAFPRFRAPKGTIVTARYPGALPARLRDVENRHAAPPPSDPPPSGYPD
jgi:hypothetical protein